MNYILPYCRDRERGRDNKNYIGNNRGGGNGGGNGGDGNGNNNRRYNSVDRDHNDRESDESDDTMSAQYYCNQDQTPSNTIIVFGLQSHITEADVCLCDYLAIDLLHICFYIILLQIMSLLIQADMAPAAIRLIRKRITGKFQ